MSGAYIVRITSKFFPCLHSSTKRSATVRTLMAGLLPCLSPVGGGARWVPVRARPKSQDEHMHASRGRANKISMKKLLRRRRVLGRGLRDPFIAFVRSDDNV